MDTTHLSIPTDSRATGKEKENGQPKRRGSSSKSQRLARSSPAANLLSPSTTSLAPSKALSSRSLSPSLRKAPSIVSIRQPQPTVAVAAPEVAVSMVFAERVEGAPLGSAEALLTGELGNASTTSLGSGGLGTSSGDAVGAESSSDTLPVETQRMTPNTSPSSLPSTSSPPRPPVSQASTSSTGWFGSLSRSKGKAASSSVSLLLEQQRKASKSPLATPKSLPLAIVSPASKPASLPSPKAVESETPQAAAAPGTAEATSGADVGAGKGGETMKRQETSDADGLPPMLTITESFPIPFNESPAEEIPPHSIAVGPDAPLESVTESNPIAISALPSATATQSILLAPANTMTPATSPPAPSSLSSTPRKRSWFYSSSLSKPTSTTPIVAPMPLSPPVPNTIVEALVHPHPPQSPPQAAGIHMATTLQWEGISASEPQMIPGRGRGVEEEERESGELGEATSIPSSIDDFVPPLPVTPPVPGQPALTSGIAAALAVAQTQDVSERSGGEGAEKKGVVESKLEEEKAGGGEKSKDGKEGVKVEEKKKEKERTGSFGGGSRFTLSIPLLGRTKIALPVGVVGGGGEEKEKDKKEKGSPSGDSQGDGGNDKGAVLVAPGTTSTSSSKDTSASTSSSPPTSNPVSSTEPVQSQEPSSASEARPPGVEGVKPEGEPHADGQVLDTQATSASSKASDPTSAGQEEGSAYYSWWNYVGWASEGAPGSAGPHDKVGPGGSLETEGRDSAKDAGVGSTVHSGETEREKAAKAEVTLTTTTTTLTTTLSSAPVTQGKPNAKGSDSIPSNGKNFDAGTSEPEDAVEGRGGTEDGRGRGKKGDGEVDVVGESAHVGQGARSASEGNKLEGADSLVSGSEVETAEVEHVSRESLDRAESGSSWLSPWAWISTSTSTTTTSTAAVVEAQPEPASTSETSKEGGEGRDAVAVVEAIGQETKEQKEDGVHNPDDDSSEPKVDEAREPTATTPERELELPNPIEASLKENRSGWASFFSKQSLLVKAIGYGDANEPRKAIKRDEDGVEVMDLDSDDDGESEAGSKKDDTSSNGGESRSRSLVPKLLTLPVEKLVGTSSSSRNSSPNPRDRSPAASDKARPAEPLTGDEDIKRKVASVPVGKKPSKGSSSGSSTPAPPSPSGSVPLPGSKQPQPPVAEKSKSEPVTPKRTASPSPSVTKKNSTLSSPPNLLLPTWADIFDTPPRSVVLRPPSPPPVSPPTTPGVVQDTGVGTRLLGKTMKFMSGVLWAKDGGQPGAGQEQHQAGPSAPGGSLRSERKDRRRFNAPHPLRRSSSGGGLDIASLLEHERKVRFERYGQELPKSWEVLEGALQNGDAGKRPALSRLASALSSSGDDVLGHVSAEEVSRGISKDVLRGCRRVVIIGVHGWFPGAVMRTVLGEPTGTSSKFANMMEQAIQEFENEHGVQLEKITKIPLEGEGTIERRVEKLYKSLIANNEWMDDLREANVIFVATHSQGSVVSTHLMSKLLQEGIIYTRPEELVPSGGDTFPSAVGIPRSSERKVQRVCCLALCGIHLGPLRYLNTSSLVAPYIQYFENAAARELFEFQSTESVVSKAYVKALENVLEHGIKMVYIASLNDQVVPIYSGVFTAATHPLILRALYIDGDAYHSSDFLSNLLVLLLRLRNSGIPDGGLLSHLSEATAGSLSGVGHSTAYEELATYSLAVRYLFMTNNGSEKHPSLVIEPFDAATEQNDYEIPWSLRDVIADERVIHFFSNEVAKLRDAFRDWHPKTTILRDLKRKLQPIQRLPPSFSSGSYSTSKL